MLIGQVELTKQLKPPLTEQQKTQLTIELYNVGESYEQMQTRAQSVKLKDTFGTIAFQYWVDDLVCLRVEAVRIAEKMIQERREQLEKLHISQETIERLGLEHVKRVAARRRDEAVERFVMGLKARVKRAEAFVRKATPDVRSEVYKLLVARGSPVATDNYWQITLHTYVADHLEAIETFIRRLPKCTT